MVHVSELILGDQLIAIPHMHIVVCAIDCECHNNLLIYWKMLCIAHQWRLIRAYAVALIWHPFSMAHQCPFTCEMKIPRRYADFRGRVPLKMAPLLGSWGHASPRKIRAPFFDNGRSTSSPLPCRASRTPWVRSPGGAESGWENSKKFGEFLSETCPKRLENGARRGLGHSCGDKTSHRCHTIYVLSPLWEMFCQAQALSWLILRSIGASRVTGSLQQGSIYCKNAKTGLRG